MVLTPRASRAELLGQGLAEVGQRVLGGVLRGDQRAGPYPGTYGEETRTTIGDQKVGPRDRMASVRGDSSAVRLPTL
jgi:hypothetical protein